MRRRILTALVLIASSAGPLRAGINRWTSGTPFWGPRYCSRVVPHPRIAGLLYANTIDGIMRSDDRGASWRLVLTRQQCVYCTFQLDPRSDRVLYADAFGGGVLRSLDGGASWAHVSDPSSPNLNALTIAPSSPGTLFALAYGTESPIWRSVDSGFSWTPLPVSPSTVFEIAVSPTDATAVYAAAGDAGVLVSMDAGDHWSASNGGLPTLAARSVSFDAADSRRMYLVNAGVVYRSSDGGTSWTRSLAGGADFFRVAAHADVPGTAYAWAFDVLYRTSDGGVHWTPGTRTPGGNRVDDVAGEPGEASSVYAAAATLYRSEDSTASWGQVGRFNPRITGTAVLCPSDEPDTVFALGGSRRFTYSVDRGQTWTLPANAGLDTLLGFNIAVSSAAPRILYAGTANGIFRTDDRGGHWTRLGPYDEETRVVLDPADGDRIYANTTVDCGRFYCIYRGDGSSDGGRTWFELRADSDDYAIPQLVSAATPQSVFGYSASFFDDAGLLRGGLDGPLFALPDGPGLQLMVADPLAPSVIYGVGYRLSESGLFRSEDAGTIWTLVSDQLFAGSLAIDPLDSSRLAAVANGEVRLSVDRAATWSAFESPPNGGSIHSLAFSADGRTLYAGTELGVFQYTFCDDWRGTAGPSRRPPGTLPERPAAP